MEWPVYDPDADQYLALNIPLQLKGGFSALSTSGYREAKFVRTRDWDEATDSLGSTALMTGPVVEWVEYSFPDGRTDPVLSLGEPFGLGAFLVRLMVDRDSLPEELYIGKTISVIGEVGPNSFGGARIWVDDLAQIEIVE